MDEPVTLYVFYVNKGALSNEEYKPISFFYSFSCKWY